MRRAATEACNTPRGAERLPMEKERAEEAVRKLFGGQVPSGFFVNTDPRGCALKLARMRCEYPRGLYVDFGDYGILAPPLD